MLLAQAIPNAQYALPAPNQRQELVDVVIVPRASTW
jgi:hypothetical protein